MKYQFAFRGFYYDYWMTIDGEIHAFIMGIDPNNYE